MMISILILLNVVSALQWHKTMPTVPCAKDKFLFIGGVHRESKLEQWSPDSSSLHPLPTLRSRATATPLPDGRVLVCGGDGVDGRRLATCDLLQPDSFSSTPAAPLPEPRSAHAAVALEDTVYLCGGFTLLGFTTSCLRYRDGTWTQVAPMGKGRGYFALASDGQGLVACGGMAMRDFRFKYSGACERYDPDSDAWSPLPPMPGGPRHAMGAVFAQGRLYVIGGQEEAKRLRRVEILDMDTGSWTEGPPLKEPRYLSNTVAKVGDDIWALGAGTNETSVEVLKAGASEWELLDKRLSSDLYLATVLHVC